MASAPKKVYRMRLQAVDIYHYHTLWPLHKFVGDVIALENIALLPCSHIQQEYACLLTEYDIFALITGCQIVACPQRPTQQQHNR